MSDTSLIAKLSNRLRHFTGEVGSTARPAMKQAVTRWTPEQRDAVLNVLRGEGVDPAARAVLACTRAILVPDARSRGQQELESVLLLALGVAKSHLQLRPPASVLRPAQPIRAVELSSATGYPILHLDEYGLGPLLMGLLPSYAEEQVNGVPGIRYRQRRRHGELMLLGADSAARVILAGVTKAVWEAALAFVNASYDEPIRWLWNTPAKAGLTAEEREHLAEHRRVYAPVHLGSAVFRRHRLLRHAQRVESRADYKEWVLEWGAGPQAAGIAADLNDPLFGVAFPATVESYGGETAWLIEQPADSAEATTPQVMSRLFLHREEGNDLDGEEEFRRWHPAPWPAWQAWENSCRRETLHLARVTRAAARRSAGERAAHTGEELLSAVAGLTPDGRIGLDDCTPRQQFLRFLLAMYLFNTRSIGAPPSWREVFTALSYTMTISPRFDDLIIFTDTPDNLVQYFADPPYERGIPGLRFLEGDDFGHHRMLHVPSGATMTITSRPERDVLALGSPTSTLAAGRVSALTRAEETDLAAIPAASDDTHKLLAGLFVRATCTAPDKRWALGNWRYDPLRRPDLDDVGRGGTHRLWGARDDWELLWSGYPHPADVVASLVDPVIGLSGVRVLEDDSPFYSLALGTARLALARWGERKPRRPQPTAA